MHPRAAEGVFQGPADGFAAVALALKWGEDVDADFGAAVVHGAEGGAVEVDLADGGSGAGSGGGVWAGGLVAWSFVVLGLRVGGRWVWWWWIGTYLLWLFPGDRLSVEALAVTRARMLMEEVTYS